MACPEVGGPENAEIDVICLMYYVDSALIIATNTSVYIPMRECN